MLDIETKRRIDTARNILVGKVPDPKSQVEQITIALIYKFMDDMDRESVQMGGKASFFTGDYKKYAWTKMFDPKLGGAETFDLYVDAISKMSKNSNIPKLFRDIFKNAYLPYKDPETLKLFLKSINEFTYDHSEKLGDAFEYLLSVLGSQGDAGQFRTPRHIIDFIVSIVDPKKDETVLDPACGTAGFLISAYKHILSANTKKTSGDKLNPSEKKQLLTNFSGYDISPDMVRLSLVNLYLHGFVQPQINEYDTLTSEERWKEYVDVILANPPFMTPKGGIKPHKRFSVKSNRSEVLFLDYMAEHLNPTGRAGIIVPEGIIFQNGKAYKELRKILLDKFLVSVISLPAGVFKPYSGVKTCILILDKSLSKQCNAISFFKVENDGFDLGDQRREIDKNDLPYVKTELEEFLSKVRNKEATNKLKISHGLIVSKEKIASDGDYNLNGERYKAVKVSNTNFPLVPIGDICELYNGRAFKPGDWKKENSGGIPIVRIQNLNNEDSKFNYFTGQVSEKNKINNGELLFSWSGSRGTSFGAHIWRGGEAVLNQHIFKIAFDQKQAKKMYLLHALNRAVIEVEENLHGGVGLVHITKGNFEKIKIPLPPLDVQNEIIDEIDCYQKVIDGSQAVLKNYRPHIPIESTWSNVNIGDICSLAGSITKEVDLKLPYFGADSIESNTGKLLKTQTAQSQRVSGPVYKFSGQRLLYSKIRPYLNKLTIVDLKGYCSSDMYPLIPNPKKVLINYLATFMLSDTFLGRIAGYYERASIPKINRKQLFETKIPLPSLEIQRKIVADIEAEQSLVASNYDLIERFENKIKLILDRVWGDVLK